ncbi:uncharacterized protein K452DRAFT_318259 [Aplosporella prunicola CBS 121167]|uniref:Rhodopsin domain-containing protein n=1 Tax=Aplosporella prunicola CBS 121167 TaxID=1176127 RepID=A0A6A6BEV3_9PEZI|nr:uncharacterized protein K452DRAFT_318259 [Aplosporella prunicola CBS 121167]KAF2142680.1 hypothetical protein K452DRAFT_318259 [Aplosporella prunicola CBS 121167]
MALSPLLIEVWVEYAVGMGVLLLRFYARWKTVGLRKFWIGDLFAGLAVLIWTVETTFIYLLRTYGNTVGLTPETALQVPDSEVARLTLGSKLAFINWIFYISFIWCLKVVLLSLYQKITMNLWQHKLIKYMYVFTASTWLACILCHVLICVPVHRSWQVKPYPGDECTIRRVDYPVIAALNVITDLGIMSIPLPILFIAKIPLHRKLILGLLFSSGIFVIICTIVRAYYSLRSTQDLQTALGWASRETCVAAIAVSAPSIKPLFNGRRWFKTGSGSGSASGAGSAIRRTAGASVASTQATAVERGASLGGAPGTKHEALDMGMGMGMAVAPMAPARVSQWDASPSPSSASASPSAHADDAHGSTSKASSLAAPPPPMDPHPGTAASPSASIVGSATSMNTSVSMNGGGGGSSVGGEYGSVSARGVHDLGDDDDDDDGGGGGSVYSGSVRRRRGEEGDDEEGGYGGGDEGEDEDDDEDFGDGDDDQEAAGARGGGGGRMSYLEALRLGPPGLWVRGVGAGGAGDGRRWRD